jgi:apolipoprotein N-acyltransferase
MRLQEKPYFFYLLALLSGLLFFLGWPTKPIPYFLFFAFIPLLIIEDQLTNSSLKKKGWKFFGYSYIALLTWNVLTTYWIYNATAFGGIFSMAANALLMCIPICLFYFTKKHTNATVGYASFIFYWITFEYWHLNWDLSWPWLTLGNGFASVPGLIQWYEYTGTLGGTLWVVVVNICVFKIYQDRKVKVKRNKYLAYAIALFFIPTLISVIIDYTYEEQGKDVEVVVVQPNIDPYEEKFQGGLRFIPYPQQKERLITLSKQAATPETKYIVWPETALPSFHFEHELTHDEDIKELENFMSLYPNACLVTGLDSYKLYQTAQTSSCSKFTDTTYIDAFNSAIQINHQSQITIYHKSKLVPGVEHVPPLLSKFAIALGEAASGLGKQKERTVFFNQDHIGVAPVICYESIFGEFVTEYVKKGASMIFIITNDGWWGNTQGHKQHLLFGALRAIENRKSIARSANTGISGFINQRGRIIKKSDYWVQDVMRIKIKENNIKTFYTLHGDYIGSFSLLVSIGLIGFVILKIVKKK